MAETILFRFNCEINGQEGLKVEYFRNFNKSRKNRKKKFEPEKGGLITLDDDLKVNSQKFEPEKKQIWTVDPQEFFRTTPNSTTLTLPHHNYYTQRSTTHSRQINGDTCSWKWKLEKTRSWKV